MTESAPQPEDRPLPIVRVAMFVTTQLRLARETLNAWAENADMNLREGDLRAMLYFQDQDAQVAQVPVADTDPFAK